MNKNTIEYLAYILNQAREEELPKAIVFLGAGASASAGIPLTHVIVRHIKIKYKKNPIIREFVSKNETDYYTIMGALTADERRDLFYFYVTRPKVKINVTNIYLAQLLKEGYIDFVLTVNFDDLLLRACALYNFLPPVYDISNISVPTTSNFREKSVIYLHGQHFGQWLLNKKEELQKSKNDVTNIFNEIKNRRTWIVVGYSGQDEIFDQITSLGSFTKEFYWVNYKDSNPSQKILNFVNNPDKNAHLLKGFDSDSFFLKLHSELSKLEKSELETPEVFNKPFTFLKSMMENVKDIEKYNIQKEHKETFKIVRERFENSKDMVLQAIDLIENNFDNKLEQEIIDAIINNDFKNADYYYEQAKKNKSLRDFVSKFFNNWGIFVSDLGIKNSDKKLLEESLEKFKIAIELNSQDAFLYNNMGTCISDLAKLLKSEDLYNSCIEKYKEAIRLKEDFPDAYYNWGVSLSELAKLNSDMSLSWKSIEKYRKAIELDYTYESAYNNLASELGDIAKFQDDKDLYVESISIYKKAIELNPQDSSVYSNLTTTMLNYSHLIENEEEKIKILIEAKNNAILTNSRISSPYNLSCAYALLNERQNAFKYLEESLSKGMIEKDYVLSDEDWNNYKRDPKFLKILSKY